MESGPVEAGFVDANLGGSAAHLRAAWRQERVVTGQGFDMILRRSRQRRTKVFFIPGVGLMPVVGRAPQEHRALNRSEAGTVKGEAERRRGSRDGADPPIRLPRIRRCLDRFCNRMDPRLGQRGAKIVPRIFRAVWVDLVEVGYSARFDEHGEAAIRESEGADALGIDVGVPPASPSA